MLRYDVVKVEGYGNSAVSDNPAARRGAKYGFTFTVIDCLTGQELRDYRGVGRTEGVPTVARARERALRHAARLNFLDLVWDDCQESRRAPV